MNCRTAWHRSRLPWRAARPPRAQSHREAATGRRRSRAPWGDVTGVGRARGEGAPSPVGTAEHASLRDVYRFGGAGLFSARRTADGAPVPIQPGPHGAPRDVPGASIAGEIFLTPRGTLALRGPMVTPAAYAPPLPPSDSLVAQPPRDYVDTDYAARLDRSTGAICITAPPSGVMAVGGYRFLSQHLQVLAL